MLKYVETAVTFAEVPLEICLCINLSNCPNHCPACHSKYLWGDIGDELDETVLSELIVKNDGVTCICFMGGDAYPDEVMKLASVVHNKFSKKVCWYSGRTREFWESTYLFPKNYSKLNYVKFGPYDEKYGSLDKPTTNQRFYEVIHNGDNGNELIDITNRFWRK